MEQQEHTTAWRPSGAVATLPADSTIIKDRAARLASLTWPTPAESLELAMLTIWQLPGIALTDTLVAEKAADRMWISPHATGPILDKVYALAEPVWHNIQQLAAGKTLPLPVATTVVGMATDNPELGEAAQQWLKGVVATLEALNRRDILFTSDMVAQLRSFGELDHDLRITYARPMFDHPLGVGASLFREPTLPGTNFGEHGKVSEIAFALAMAADQMMETYRKTASSPDESFHRDSAQSALFFWWLLKGYIYEGVNSSKGIMMPAVFSVKSSAWSYIKEVLTEGLAFAQTFQEDDISSSWLANGTNRSKAIAEKPTGELIETMDALIAEQIKFNEQLKRMH